ncbi:hypothetical protein AKJ16_DCAP05374 [Drosera capensis]
MRYLCPARGRFRFVLYPLIESSRARHDGHRDSVIGPSIPGEGWHLFFSSSGNLFSCYRMQSQVLNIDVTPNDGCC